MTVNNKIHQRGWTMIGGLMALIIIAFVVLIGMKIVPIYIDYYNIQSSIKSISKEPGVEQGGLRAMCRGPWSDTLISVISK